MSEMNQLQNIARLKKLDVLFFFLSLFLIVSLIISATIKNTVPLFLYGIYGVACLTASIAVFIQTLKFKGFSSLTRDSHKEKNDCMLLLQDVVGELEAFSNLVFVNLEGLGEMIGNVAIHLGQLNEKIESMGKDIGNVYTVVSNLANQEVLLMDAVGKTSEEIHIMFEIVNAVIDEIQGRNKTMEELVERSKAGREKVTNTSETINRLSESSGGILKLIDFINSVSKETNLLAINASIEATHSGSEGKGFTVIADEIRKLATQTAQNSREINTLLRSNIADFSLASMATKDSGAAFEFIANEIHVVHGTIAEVVQSISELKTRGKFILEKSKSLDEIAASVRDTSGEVYGEIFTINGNLEETQKLSSLIEKECLDIRDSKDWLFRLTRKMLTKIEEIKLGTNL